MARRLAIAAVIAVCLAAPIAEMFDRWDDTQHPADDSEMNVVVVALCVGVVLAIGPVVIANRIRSVFSTLARRWNVSDLDLHALTTAPAVPLPTTSPPAVIRV